MPSSKPISARELLAQAKAQAEARQKAGHPVLLSPGTTYNAARDEATVYIYDPIGAWYGLDPKTWIPEFNAIKAKTIHLRVNSPGGSVLDCQAMRTAIAQHPARTIAHIDGLAASAATTLAIAAREVEMTDGAQFMIHCAWGICCGCEQDMIAYGDLLKKCTDFIVQDYMRKTGRPAAQIRRWMDKETWFTAAEALEHGFVDRIFEVGASNAADSDKDRRARALRLQKLSMNS